MARWEPLIPAAAPDTRSVYVSYAGDGANSVIDTASRTVRDTIEVGGSPVGVGLAPDGSRLYVANSAAGELVILDPATKTEVDHVPVGAAPIGLGIALGPGTKPATPLPSPVAWTQGASNVGAAA